MELIPIEDPEAAARKEKLYATEDHNFHIRVSGQFFTIIPNMPYISGIVSSDNLIQALSESKDKLLEGIGILTLRINQLSKMIQEEEQKTFRGTPDLSDPSDPSDLSDPSDKSVPPENEKPADTPNAAGSSNNTSRAI